MTQSRRSMLSAAGYALIGPLALSSMSGMLGCKGGGKGQGSGSARAGKGGKGGGPSFPVEVFSVEAHQIEYVVDAPGSLDAFERVQVTARVAGGVDKVGFVEGQTVKKGDVLVVIDSQRYRLAVNAASAQVAKAKAMEADAQAMVTRRETASAKHPGLIPGEEISTLKTKVLTAQADRDLAVQDYLTAELNLKDSSVRAPIDGVIQTRTIETGQYVSAGYVMATLLRSEPMLLRFQVAPIEAPRIKIGALVNFRLRETLRVFKAKVTLVSAAADPETRLVPVTAEVDDTDHDYWLRPGSFCDVSVKLGGSRSVIAIPRTAVRPSEKGFLAYVVEDNIAQERVLTLGMNTSDGWVEVRDGMKVGDKLVLRGAEPLIDKSKVKAEDVPPPTSSAFLSPATSATGAPTSPQVPPTNAAPSPGASVRPSASGAP